MNNLNIPPSFWHSLSICILVATFGAILIAYKSSSISITHQNTKIDILLAAHKLREISQDISNKIPEEYTEPVQEPVKALPYVADQTEVQHAAKSTATQIQQSSNRETLYSDNKNPTKINEINEINEKIKSIENLLSK